jgi:hypothetical protein
MTWAFAFCRVSFIFDQAEKVFSFAEVLVLPCLKKEYFTGFDYNLY